jgi:hypothetical protein
VKGEHKLQDFGHKIRKVFAPPRDEVYLSNLEYNTTRNSTICLWVSTVTRLRAGSATEVRFPAGIGKGFFCLRYRVQTGSGAHQAFHPGANGVKLPESSSDDIKNA